MYVSTKNSNFCNYPLSETTNIYRPERDRATENYLIGYLSKSSSINDFNIKLEEFLRSGKNINSLFKICKSYIPSHKNICSAIGMLHIGAYHNTFDCVKELLKNHANPNIQLLDGSSPLHFACEKNNIESVELLLRYSANPDIQLLEGSTPLHFACEKNGIELVRLLVKYHANTQIYNKAGWSPMHIACNNDKHEIIDALIQDNPTNINIQALKNKETPLIFACKNNQKETALFLINKGADVNLRDATGWQAIHHASCIGNEDLVIALLNKGADINSKAPLFKGRATPLIVALEKERYDFAESLILNYGASVHDRGISEVARCFQSDVRNNSICCYLTCAPLDLCFLDFCNYKNDDSAIALPRRTVCLCLQPSVAELAGEEFMARVKSRLNNTNCRQNIANIEQSSAIITEQPELSANNKQTTSSCFPFWPSFNRNRETEVIYIGYPVGEAPPAYEE